MPVACCAARPCQLIQAGMLTAVHHQAMLSKQLPYLRGVHVIDEDLHFQAEKSLWQSLTVLVILHDG
jgi:hypothetical protein